MTEDERRAKYYAGKGHKKRRKDLKDRKKSDEKLEKAIIKGSMLSVHGKDGKLNPMKKERLLEGFAPGKDKILHSDKKMQGLKGGGRAGYKGGGAAIKGVSKILR